MERDGTGEVEEAKQKRKSWKAAVILAAAACTAGGLFFFYYRIYRVVPVFSEMVYEYGESPSRDITDYLSGTDWSVHLGELDLSQVDEGRTGTYEAVVYHGGTQYVYELTIQDTVPPEIVWREEQIYLPAAQTCGVEDVIAGGEDVDPKAKAYFLQADELLEEIRFDSTGQYDLEMIARDSAGNETRGMISVVVDTPPVFGGIRNFYCVPGSEPDFLEAVTARDDLDGDLTDSIVVDDTAVNLAEDGMYELYYLAEDSYGLETVEKATVMVASGEEIQELIGQRRINYRTDTILGAPNIYDAGAADREDMEATLQYMRPALVQLYHGVGRGGYSAGSGYIMEITEDTVYICSNSHVVEKYEDWDVYFYDGTVVKGKAVGISEVYDVGVAAVALEDVPEELQEKLMTVHIDRTYWETLDQQKLGLALERIDREGGLLHVTEGELIKIKQDFGWNDMSDHTEVTVELVHGDSGSAVLDGYGNLICMAYAYSTEPIRFWCVPLDGILECYQEITGRMPFVY